MSYLVGVDPSVPLFLAIILQEIVFLVIVIPMTVAVGMAVVPFFFFMLILVHLWIRLSQNFE